MQKSILMLAGPNGAGKTTYARAVLANRNIYGEYLNADEIAHGLAPLHPESVALTASKLLITRFEQLLTEGGSFAFETTGAGKNYAVHLAKARSLGYQCDLLFLWLPSPQYAINRVTQRVQQGGHSIPVETIERRYRLGLANLIELYLPIVDSAVVLDGSADPSRVILLKSKMDGIEIVDRSIWDQIVGVSDGK